MQHRIRPPLGPVIVAELSCLVAQACTLTLDEPRYHTTARVEVDAAVGVDVPRPSCTSDAGRSPTEPVVAYDFRNLETDQVGDRAPRPPDVPLHGDGAFERAVEGLRLIDATFAASPAASRALGETLRQRGALTVEVWVSTDRVDNRGPARIVSLSRNINARAFTLAQQEHDYVARLRTTATVPNGMLTSGVPLHAAPAFPTHGPRQLALVFDGATARSMIVLDGRVVDAIDHVNDDGTPATLASWDLTDHLLLVGNETAVPDGQLRHWTGTIHTLAIFDRALDPAEIRCRYAEGPGPATGR